ncbi:hypothetical protein WIX39_026150 [Variovorax sp. AB1(2024)]|uniref:hypothetical protein n=1 Tax=Variovorax sp. AB1(2024) TaxID=3132214 RepID=UPI0030AC06BE
MLDHLAFFYQVIIASEFLLKEAIFLLGDDGFEGDLKAFYAKHLEDEKGHAEWLKEDLGEHPINLHFGAAQLAGMAYYLVRHVHPVALLGYMKALEGHPIPIEYVEAVEKAHGAQAGRTLRLHAIEDPHHMQELEAVAVPSQWAPLVESTRLQTRKLIEGLS